MIGALHALTSCAWFSCCTNADDLEWRRFTEGTLTILQLYGWEAIMPPTRQAFYYNWKYRTFFEGLTRRTKISFTEPPDPAIIEPSGGLLTEHAFDIPGLLWRTDQFVSAAKSRTISAYMITRLLTEIGVCISQLKCWRWYFTQ